MGFSPTVKSHALTASGNRCAYPSCPEYIFDPKSETLLGEVAHIKGNKIGTARHDAQQSDEERQSFKNAIVLCRKHHPIVDNRKNVSEYPTERLLKWKAEHEAKIAGQHFGPWLRPPNSATMLHDGEQITLHFWVDGDGNAHLYSDKQFAQSEAALQLRLLLGQIKSFIETVEALTIPENNKPDGGQIAYIKQQAKTYLSSSDAIFKDAIQIFTMLEDVTFGEFIAAIIQPRSERADYDRRRADIAHEAESMQRERARQARTLQWKKKS